MNTIDLPKSITPSTFKIPNALTTPFTPCASKLMAETNSEGNA